MCHFFEQHNFFWKLLLTKLSRSHLQSKSSDVFLQNELICLLLYCFMFQSYDFWPFVPWNRKGQCRDSCILKKLDNVGQSTEPPWFKKSNRALPSTILLCVNSSLISQKNEKGFRKKAFASVFYCLLFRTTENLLSLLCGRWTYLH